MIEFKQGNIFNEDVEALVNPVNCIGVMGKGLALEFKQTYPKVFEVYKKACDRGELQPGKLLTVTNDLIVHRYIIHFPTKQHWRDRSKIHHIKMGLAVLVTEIKILDIQSIAIPALGCGNGGLDWLTVKPLIEAALKKLPDVKTIVFEPIPTALSPAQFPQLKNSQSGNML